MARPRGHSEYPIRPGLFIRNHLLNEVDGGESNPSAMFREYRAVVAAVNDDRFLKDPSLPTIHGMVFSSFYRYLKHLEYFGLVYRTGREEPMDKAPDILLQLRKKPRRKVVDGVIVFYALTPLGKAEPPHPAFIDPIAVWKGNGNSYTPQ